MKAVLSGILLACLAVTAPAAQAADTYPSKAITIIVPFPPGGGPDKLARVIGEKLMTRFGQTVIVENKPGASGVLGAAYVAKSTPDGYTLMMTPNTFVLSALVLPKDVVSYDVQKDFAPVIIPSKGLLVLAAHPSLGVKNGKELVQYARKNPGVAFTGSSNGSPMHIAGEMFKQVAGVDMMFVAYKGLAPALADTLGGQVKLIFGTYGTLAPYLKSGALVALGGLDPERSALVPELPTLTEQGFPNMSVGIWNGLFAPKNTPRAVIDTLNREINAVIQLPDVKQKLETTGEVLVGGPPEVLATQVRHDVETFAPIVKSAHITAD